MLTRKSLIPFGLSICFVLSILSVDVLKAQHNGDPDFAMLTCLKSKSQDINAFMEEIGKPFHDKLVKDGKILDWMFFRTVSPNGQDCQCDYYMMTIVTNPAGLEMMMTDAMGAEFDKYFPDTDLDKLFERWEAAVEAVNDRVYIIRDGLEPPTDKMKYAVINYMTVAEGDGGNYASLEAKYFKPIHAARIKAGKMHTWGLMARMMPYGSSWDGNFVTIDAYDSFQQMMSLNDSGLWKSVHPNKTAGEAFAEITKLRELTRSETTQLVLRTDQP